MKQPAMQLKQPISGSMAATSAKQRAALQAEAASQDSPAHNTKPLRGLFGWKPKVRPDHSKEGFERATKEAIRFAETIEYVSADYMCEEIEHLIGEALNAPDCVHCEFVGRHKDDRAPRLIIITNWGLRLAVKGLISFTLMQSPERRQK